MATLLTTLLVQPTRVSGQTSVFGLNSAGGVLLDLAPMPQMTGPQNDGPRAYRSPSALRYVSLTRVLKRAQAFTALDDAPHDVRCLAELDRITHVIAYPEAGELVLAGPVSSRPSPATAAAQPTLRPAQLDLLLSALRYVLCDAARGLRCSIDPQTTSALPVPRHFVEQQQISVDGVARTSPLAHTCVAADIRLKHLALGAVPSRIPALPELAAMVPRAAAGSAAHVWLEARTPLLWHAANRRVWALDEPQVRGHARQLAGAVRQSSHNGRAVGVAAWADELTRCYDQLAERHEAFADLTRLINFCQVARLLCEPEFSSFELPGRATPRTADAYEYREAVPSRMPTSFRSRRIGRKRLVISGGIEIDLHALDANVASELDDAAFIEAGQPPTDSDVWWWDPSLHPPSNATGSSQCPASFYDVPVADENVVFLIDKSFSMRLPSAAASGSRWQRAVQQLRVALAEPARAARADVLLFDERVRAWGSLPHRPALERFLSTQTCSGDTNLGGALAYALRAYPRCSTLFVLSDGELNAGRVDPATLTGAVRRWNSAARIRLVTLGIAPLPRGEALLRQLAFDSGGAYVRVE